MNESAETEIEREWENERERERDDHMNGVSGDLTRPRLNAEHRKATLKPVQIYLYITYKRSQQTLWTWKHTDIMSR